MAKDVFSKEILDLLHGPPPFGTPFGRVFPFRSVPSPPLVDGRTTALRILKKYLREITFYRHGGYDENKVEKPPIAWRLAERDIHIEWPDAPEDVHLPAVAFLSSSPAEYDAIGMTSYVDESTLDKYGAGTVIFWCSEYIETFQIELWCETKAQRRAMLVGMEKAMTPLEYMAGIRFRMPDYYDQLVCFSLNSRTLVDDENATKNRRKAILDVEMRFNVVALYPVNQLQPELRIEVDEGTLPEEEPEDPEETNAEVQAPDDD